MRRGFGIVLAAFYGVGAGESQQQIWSEILQQFEQTKQIASDLDPLVSQPHWELVAVRALLAGAENFQD